MVNESRQRLIYVLSDFVMTNIAWLLFNIIRYYFIVEPTMQQDSLISFLTLKPVLIGQLILPLMMELIYYISGYYNVVFGRSRLDELLNTIASVVIGSIVIFFITIIDDPIPDRASNYELLILLIGLLFVCVYSVRFMITRTAVHNLHTRKWSFNTLIVGTTRYAVDLERRLMGMERSMGFNIVGFINPTPGIEPTTDPGLPVYSIDDIEQVCRQHNVKRLIIMPHRYGMRETISLINRLFPLDLPMLISPDLYHLITSHYRIGDIVGEPLVDISRTAMSQSTVALKRFSDIVVSAITLLLLLPVYAVIAFAVKRDSPGPVFYRQERIGMHKRPFKIIKFRTMYTDAESSGPALSSTDDPRITKVGRILRKYRLDELPQFYNVLVGEMSMVGPRPEREYYIKQIMAKAPYYTLMHQVRPGITSWGMVKYGYASTVDEMVTRLKYDLMYIENVSMLIDLKILFYTVNTVVTGKGV